MMAYSQRSLPDLRPKESLLIRRLRRGVRRWRSSAGTPSVLHLDYALETQTTETGRRAGNQTRIPSLKPKPHRALNHASPTKSGRDAEEHPDVGGEEAHLPHHLLQPTV